MDFTLLSSVVGELAGVLPGARVDRVYQDAGGNLVILLHQAKKNYPLFLSPDRNHPRLHLLSGKPPAAGSSAGFFQFLRKHLAGTRLRDICLLQGDRIVELRFARPGSEIRLLFEVFGPSANLIATDASYKILSVLRSVSLGEGAGRPLLSGLVYTPPQQKQHPAGRPLPAAARPADPSSDTPVNRAAEEYYHQLLRRERDSTLRRSLAAALRSASARTARRIAALERDRKTAEDAESYRLRGELLLANRASTPHDGQVAAQAYDGSTVTIPIDPALSIPANAERYFKKYKKAKAGVEVIRERLQQSQDEAAYLEALGNDLDQAGDGAALDRVRDALAGRGYLGGAAERKKEEPSALPFRKLLYEGWEIYIGKSASGNDYLTTKLARPEDLWLHAEGMPGSHVLVRNPRRSDVPSSVLMKAASLAAYYSKGKGATKVPVAYTPAKFVRKPKGARPGSVTLAERKTVMAAPAAP